MDLIYVNLLLISFSILLIQVKAHYKNYITYAKKLYAQVNSFNQSYTDINCVIDSYMA